MRHLLSRRTWFYRVFLPLAFRLGPARADRLLVALSRATARRRLLADRLTAARSALGASWNLPEALEGLRANLLRFEARDYPLAGLSDAEALGRFELHGLTHLESTLNGPTAPILLGSHFGAYLAGLHWLRRKSIPMRLLVQRPHHVSPELHALFDEGLGTALAQTHFFLRRHMPPGEGARRLWLARTALRSGLAVYVNGDVAWPDGCAQPGVLLGQRRRFLSAWATLAVMTGAPVLPLFCRHLPFGRFALEFLPPWRLSPGDEPAAVGRYLGLLESRIAQDPSESVAYLTWPSFAEVSRARRIRPARLPRSLRSQSVTS